MDRNLVDILLFPGNFYKRLNRNKATLYLGIFAIGIYDIAFKIIGSYSTLFTGKSTSALVFNYTYAVVLAVLVGFVDVLFFTLPIFDLGKFVKKREGIQVDSGDVIRLMKAYITAHFLIIPLNTALFLMVRNPANLSIAAQMFIVLYFELLMPVWFSAAVTRGVNNVLDLSPVFRRVSFIVVFLWTSLFNQAFNYLLGHWLMTLFR